MGAVTGVWIYLAVGGAEPIYIQGDTLEQRNVADQLQVWRRDRVVAVFNHDSVAGWSYVFEGEKVTIPKWAA